MTTPTLPAYEAKTRPTPNCGYDKRVEAYGKPPTGYRWLKVGEKMPAESIYANYYDKKWLKTSFNETVQDSHYAFAAPVTPELIPADPSAAVALEVVGRNSTAVRFKIARQTYGGPNFETVFEASNGISINSYYYPEAPTDRSGAVRKFYLRGTKKHRDNDILSCTPAQFKRIVAALAEYNASLTPKAETKIVPSPTVAELQSEIAALKAKVTEQEKSLAKIKAIVA